MGHLAGETITADALNQWHPVRITKSANEPRTSTTTVAADAELVTTIPAGHKVHILYRLLVSGAATGDWKGRLSWTGTATVTYSIMGPGTGVASTSAGADVATGPTNRLDTASPGADMIAGVTPSGHMIILEATVTADAGGDVVLTLDWAQNVSDVTATNVLSGSSLTQIRAEES